MKVISLDQGLITIRLAVDECIGLAKACNQWDGDAETNPDHLRAIASALSMAALFDTAIGETMPGDETHIMLKTYASKFAPGVTCV